MTLCMYLFLFFSTLTLSSAFLVINTKNSVHSVLFLILTFCGSSGLLVLLGVEFFAMLYLIVYVGAVAVLFLFVLMMLTKKDIERDQQISQYTPIGLWLGLIFMTEVYLLISKDFVPDLSLDVPTYRMVEHCIYSNITHVEVLGSLLYTYYFYFFIVASLILLIAMIGAIILTGELKRDKESKSQYINQQISRDFKNSIFLVKKK
jgi:NADH-quinone oxidoreductase subunit J